MQSTSGKWHRACGGAQFSASFSEARDDVRHAVTRSRVLQPPRQRHALESRRQDGRRVVRDVLPEDEAVKTPGSIFEREDVIRERKRRYEVRFEAEAA